MAHLKILIAVPLALMTYQASAATVGYDVALHPKDRGVVWTEHGFRPVEGPDVYLADKWECPKVGVPWKNTQTDTVERRTSCASPKKTLPPMIPPLVGYPPAVVSYPPQTPTYRPPFLPPLICCGGGSNPPPYYPPYEPPLPPVPLPATVWMLLGALTVLVYIRKSYYVS